MKNQRALLTHAWKANPNARRFGQPSLDLFWVVVSNGVEHVLGKKAELSQWAAQNRAESLGFAL